MTLLPLFYATLYWLYLQKIFGDVEKDKAIFLDCYWNCTDNFCFFHERKIERHNFGKDAARGFSRKYFNC